MGKLDQAVWVGWKDRAEADKKTAGKTDADLAAEVSELLEYEVSRALVNAWFRGRREPSIREFMALCTALGSDAGEVLLNVKLTYRQLPTLSAAAVAIREPGGNPEYLTSAAKKLKKAPKGARTAKRKKRTVPSST